MNLQQFKAVVIIAFTLFAIAGAWEMVYAAPPLKLSPNNLPNGTQYAVYSQTLNASGGTPPYFWSQTGALPTGLTFTPTGTTAAISGIPTQAGTFAFTVTLTDSAGGSDFKNYSITITPGTCTFSGSNTGAISFGAIDPSTTPGPILGTVSQQVQFTCQAGKAYTVAVNPASGWTINFGANTIPFTLGFIAGGTGLGATPINLLTTNSQILQANYLNAAAGAYANNQPVNLTISWTAPAGSITATLPIGGVSGTVINTCAVSQMPGTLTFAIDPSVPGMTSATIAPDMLIKCTNADSVVITASSRCGGASPQLDSAYPACGGSQIPYTFNFVSSATGLGFGTAIPLNIGGSATSANYQSAPEGTYGDLQTLTIMY